MSGQAKIVEEAQEQFKGGTWKSDELESFTGWSGEVGSKQSKEKVSVSHKPLTRSQEDAEILAALSIQEDEMAALTRQIERRMLRNAGRSSTSLLASITEESRAKEEKLKTWIAASSSHESNKALPQVEVLERQLAGLTDQLTVLQRKVDEMLASQLERTEAETTMIQEAYNIIITQHREEADTGQTPSEVHRMEDHVELLKARSARLADMTSKAPASLTVTRQSDKRKKRFGTL